MSVLCSLFIPDQWIVQLAQLVEHQLSTAASQVRSPVWNVGWHVFAKFDMVVIPDSLIHSRVSSINTDHIFTLKTEHTDSVPIQRVCTVWVPMSTQCVCPQNTIQSGKQRETRKEV